jgi:dCMP deaminase
MRPEWDEFFLGLAKYVSVRGDCTRRQVGAVIVDSDHRVLSIGYNGAPAGDPGCLTAGACPRGHKSQAEVKSGTGSYSDCIAAHAEANALLYSDPLRRRGGTLYCSEECCHNCMILVRASGLSKLVSPSGIRNLSVNPN